MQLPTGASLVLQPVRLLDLMSPNGPNGPISFPHFFHAAGHVLVKVSSYPEPRRCSADAAKIPLYLLPFCFDRAPYISALAHTVRRILREIEA